MRRFMKPVCLGVTLALVLMIGMMVLPTGAYTSADIDLDFTGTPTSGYAPLAVDFETNVSYPEYYEFEWDFGDGETGSGPTPSHTYTCAGEFDVTCTIYCLETESPESFGSGLALALDENGYYYEKTKEAYITVKPRADFSASPTMGQAPLTVQFKDKSTGLCSTSDATWHWAFGDGHTSSSRHPAHTYQNAGNYTVSLTVSGSPSDTKTINFYIIVDESESPPNLVVRNVEVNPTYAQPGQEIQVTATITNEGGSWGSDNVQMLINGYFEQEQGVGLAPGTSETISFTIYKTEAREYQINMGNATGTFFVMEDEEQATPQSGLLPGGTLDESNALRYNTARGQDISPARLLSKMVSGRSLV